MHTLLALFIVIIVIYIINPMILVRLFYVALALIIAFLILAAINVSHHP